MADTLRTLSMAAYIVASIFLLLAIVFWIVFKIPTVMEELSGRRGRKSVAKIRAKNEKKDTGVRYELLPGGEKTEFLTGSEETELLTGSEGTELLQESEETELLQKSEGTELLQEDERIELLTGMVESLEEPGEEAWEEPRGESKREQSDGKFLMEEEILLIHTEEEILPREGCSSKAGEIHE